MKKTPVSFSLHRRREGAHHLMDIELYAASSDHRSGLFLGKVRYQANADAPTNWYSGDFETNTHGIRELTENLALIRRALGDVQTYGNAVEVLLKLSALPQTVYDPRLSNRVEMGNVLPSDYAAYRDDYNVVDYGRDSSGCTVGCVARDDEEARRLLTVEFCQPGWGDRERRFNLWLAAGRPVLRLGKEFHGYPRFTPLAEVLDEIDAAKADAPVEQAA